MADLNFSLLPWQQEVFKDATRFKVVAAGRRCGKSRMAAVTLLIEGLSVHKALRFFTLVPLWDKAVKSFGTYC